MANRPLNLISGRDSHHGVAAAHDRQQYLRLVEGSVERVHPASDGAVVSQRGLWKRAVVIHSHATVAGVDVILRPAQPWCLVPSPAVGQRTVAADVVALVGRPCFTYIYGWATGTTGTGKSRSPNNSGVHIPVAKITVSVSTADSVLVVEVAVPSSSAWLTGSARQ